MATSTRARLKVQENLYAAFLKHRRGDYDLILDDDLKSAGETILHENSPTKKSRLNPHSVFWMVAAIAVFYYTDIYMAIRVDDRIHRPWLYVGGGLITINLVIGFYFVVVCSYIRKVDWDKESPVLIPIATFSFIIGLICCTVAFWPVWSFFTPFILFTLFMGIVFLTTLIPV